MTDEGIRSRLEAGVLHLEIARREKKNSLTQAMYAALIAAIEAAREDSGVRVVLLRGQDDLYTAGNDVAEFLRRRPGEVSAAMRFIEAIAACEKPLVAAVAGDAIGIGTTMLLHCDLVYAADNARFKLPFVPLGLCPEACSSLLLPRLVGHQRAAELLFFGEAFDASTAHRLGLVNAVFASGELMEKASGRARQLAALPQEALAATKALLKRAQAEELRQTMAVEIQRFGELLARPAARERFSAFLEKRQATPPAQA